MQALDDNLVLSLIAWLRGAGLGGAGESELLAGL